MLLTMLEQDFLVVLAEVVLLEMALLVQEHQVQYKDMLVDVVVLMMELQKILVAEAEDLLVLDKMHLIVGAQMVVMDN